MCRHRGSRSISRALPEAGVLGRISSAGTSRRERWQQYQLTSIIAAVYRAVTDRAIFQSKQYLIFGVTNSTSL